MKITTITCSRSEKRAIFGQYEPTEVFFSATAEVLEGEDIHQAYQDLQAVVDEEVDLKLTILMEPQKVVRAAAKQVISKNAPF